MEKLPKKQKVEKRKKEKEIAHMHRAESIPCSSLLNFWYSSSSSLAIFQKYGFLTKAPLRVEQENNPLNNTSLRNKQYREEYAIEF